MDVLCEETDKKYRVSVTRPTSDAAVLCVVEKATSEKWFRNIKFGSVDDNCCENSDAFNHAPSAVVALIEDAVRAAAKADFGAGQDRFSVGVEHCSAYCKWLKFSFKADEDVFDWVFPMLPEDIVAIQARDNLRPIAALVEDLSEKKLDSFHDTLARTKDQEEKASTNSAKDQ